MTIATTAPTRSSGAFAKRLVLPLVVVAALTGLAMVGGVPWTADGSEAAAGFKLTATEGQGATLTISKLEPGDSASKTVTIRNSSADDSRLSFEENADQATFANGQLQLEIQQDGRTVYQGAFGAMNDVAQDVGTLPAGGSSKFTFTVSLPKDAPYANQGAPATATYTWVNTDITG